MLQRLVIVLALCLPLIVPSPGRGVEQGGVGTLDSDALQLQALGETASKLAALAKLPEKESATPKEKPKQKKKAPQRKKAHGKGHQVHQSADVKPEGRRLTVREVEGILAGTRDLSGADLSGLDLAGMDLRGVNFSRADLSRANLATADLSEADLLLADLSNANFTRASLRMARLYGTRTWGARFDGALWVDRTVCRSGSLGRCLE